MNSSQSTPASPSREPKQTRSDFSVTIPIFSLLGTGITIFVVNAVSLILQLLAGRYLAPFIGSSIETWT